MAPREAQISGREVSYKEAKESTYWTLPPGMTSLLLTFTIKLDIASKKICSSNSLPNLHQHHKRWSSVISKQNLGYAYRISAYLATLKHLNLDFKYRPICNVSGFLPLDKVVAESMLNRKGRNYFSFHSLTKLKAEKHFPSLFPVICQFMDTTMGERKHTSWLKLLSSTVNDSTL